MSRTSYRVSYAGINIHRAYRLLTEQYIQEEIRNTLLQNASTTAKVEFHLHPPLLRPTLALHLNQYRHNHVVHGSAEHHF